MLQSAAIGRQEHTEGGSVVAGVATQAAAAGTAQMPGLAAAVTLEAKGTHETESAHIEKGTKN